jgi:nucleoside-diphosphate-sugar epimerase
MEMLWDGDMKLSTLHVFDAARAIAHAARKIEPGAVFNVADKGDSDAGKLTAILGQAFNIPVGFAGTVKSNLAAL